jgi:prepilin-type N-terminal cleavage/methylation domain-containing protein
MKTIFAGTPIRNCRRGFTLIEISLVISLILGLIAIVGLNMSAVQKWQRGKDASLGLQAVFSAQRSYMADHPTANIAVVSAAQLQVYLPLGWSTMPTFLNLDDEPLTLDYNIMPPKLYFGGTVYDPSGKPSDGLWDTAQ